MAPRPLVGIVLSLAAPARAFSVPPIPGLDAYVTSLAVHPLETKVATAGVLALGSDAIAQRGTDEPYDRARAASFVLFDAAYRGGFQHAAFPWIIEHCRGDLLHSVASGIPMDAAAAIECTGFNQLVVVPIVYYPLFFAITGAVQGLDGSASLSRAKSQFVPLTIRNWQFWIPAQLCQFAFLEEQWQVPYTCVMGVIWNVILSASAGSAKVEPVQADGVKKGVVVPRPEELAGSARKSKSR